VVGTIDGSMCCSGFSRSALLPHEYVWGSVGGLTLLILAAACLVPASRGAYLPQIPPSGNPASPIAPSNDPDFAASGHESQRQKPIWLRGLRQIWGRRMNFTSTTYPLFEDELSNPVHMWCQRSLFRRIEFTKYPSGHVVPIEVEDHPSNDPWKAVLKATFARRVTIGDGKIVRIRFSPDVTKETDTEESE